MEYPIEATFRDDDGAGVIRLKVAAICACLDSEPDGTGYPDEEIEPFFQLVKKVGRSGTEYEGQIDPHAFLYLQPAGNLAIDVDSVVDALRMSIDKGHLKPAFLKIDLDGVIDAVGTWILTTDFYKWCASRGFQHGDVCSDYDDGEGSIFDQALNNADDRRKELEAPYFDAGYKTQSDTTNIAIENLRAKCDDLYLENMIMRQGFLPEKPVEERPLRTRERNTLLSIIAVLCRESKYDYARPAKIAGLIKKKAEEMGLDIGESTIENHLKKIPEALEVRMR